MPPLRVVQVNYAYDEALVDPEALLARYETLTGWSEALAEAGVAASVVQKFHTEAQVERGGVGYRFTPRPSRAFAPDSAHDIVHINGLTFARNARWLRRRLQPQAAIVIQDHGTLPPAGGAFAARLKAARWRAVLGAADALLFAAAEQGEAWRQGGMVAATQLIGVVPEASSRFVPLERETARSATGIAGDPAVLWVGRLNDNKDPLTVLDGFERAATRLPAARLVMIHGDAPLLEQVRARIARSRILCGSVALVGEVPHARLPLFYSAADLFVLGSHHEAYGYAMMEACACGVWPVVTDLPSFRAMTDRGVIGTLWRPGSAADFCDALLDAASLARATRAAAVSRHFADALSWSAVERRAVEFYEQVRAGRQRAIRL